MVKKMETCTNKECKNCKNKDWDNKKLFSFRTINQCRNCYSDIVLISKKVTQ